jgi:hypothetical protein
MIHNDDFLDSTLIDGNADGQITISYELLCLLRWMIENEAETLRGMVERALKSGLQKTLQHVDTVKDSQLASAGMQDNMSDFFKLLEYLLINSINEQVLVKAKQKQLMQDINKIDSNLCDDEMVLSALEKTTSKLDLNPDINAKEQLYKEILKQWQPNHGKKKVYN